MATEPSDFGQPPTQMPPETPFMQPQPSTWPKTIGIIAIVFGVLGTLNGFCQGVSSGFGADIMQNMAASIPDAQGAEGLTQQAESLRENASKFMILAGAAIGLGILLLVAGIGLTGRKPSGVKLVRIWAVCKIVFAVASTGMAVLFNLKAMERMPQTSTGMPAMDSAVEAGMYVGFVVSFVWLCALPVFMLIWFARGKIREEVAQWIG